MTIRKLTVAAAIAVGIASCSLNGAMAACPCNTQSMTNTACPTCNTCPTTTTTPACCPTTTSCDCAPKCDCTPNCQPAQPACGTCPSTSCSDLDMKQVYAYPAAIYGDNNYVGEQTNAIYSTETAWMLDCRDHLGLAKNGLTGCAAPLNNSCGCNSGCGCECADVGVVVCGPCGRGGKQHLGYATGAAASCGECLPIINSAACGCNGSMTGAACGCDSGCTNSIQTSNSLKAIKRSFSSFNLEQGQTGAAAPMIGTFPDVPESHWASCAIDRLACTNVIAGYPDRTYKPSLPVSRAEFASLMVKGLNLNLEGCCLSNQKIFKDVGCNHWANPVIAKAVESGIMCGYPNSMFKPKMPVSRAEALTAMAHGINCDMDSCKAKEILGQYCDGNKVPEWAQIPVAKALQSGALNSTPNPKIIDPCNDASRAEIASMLQTVRIATGLDSTPVASKPGCACAACEQSCDKKAYMESDSIISIPTLKVRFLDEINAKSSRVGQQFAAVTTEEMTLNGVCYPCGSRVNGKIVEVIRPSGCEKGALKVSFLNIEGCNGCKVDLPKQILSAQISCEKRQNAVARFVAMPFTLVGSLLGTTGRTIGGMISNAGNAAESVSNGVGIASSEIFQGQFRAAGRSLQDSAKEAIIAPVDFTRTALSGTVGLFQSTGDEVAYLVDPKGAKISAINPKEHVTIAFGCMK